jgi:hypothetical protein
MMTANRKKPHVLLRLTAAAVAWMVAVKCWNFVQTTRSWLGSNTYA